MISAANAWADELDSLIVSSSAKSMTAKVLKDFLAELEQSTKGNKAELLLRYRQCSLPSKPTPKRHQLPEDIHTHKYIYIRFGRFCMFKNPMNLQDFEPSSV